jgi:predicted transport protein
MKGGFRESPIRLNEGLGARDTWDEAAIQERAQRLAELAVEVWAPPALSPDALATYRPKPGRRAGYSLDDHAQLAASSPMGPLFQAFRNEVLSLDPCVSEEILKLYVAYKAETNFVDVVPQKRRLLLSLNLDFHELHDPRGRARDVTNLGRWGNGNVQVDLGQLDELPYVLGLVRQAFEKQMGNGEVDA